MQILRVGASLSDQQAGQAQAEDHKTDDNESVVRPIVRLSRSCSKMDQLNNNKSEVFQLTNQIIRLPQNSTICSTKWT